MQKKIFKVSQLANLLHLSFIGEDIEIKGINTLEDAVSHDISFLSNPRYINQLETTCAGVIILKEEFAHRVKNALISANPYEDFAKTSALFAVPQGFLQGVHEQAYIHQTASIGKNCTIYPFVTIGANAQIGDDCVLFSGVYVGEDSILGNGCVLYPNSVVMGNVQLGSYCCLQPGAVLGAEGFGFIRTPIGNQKIPQIGTVTLGDKVEIGANSCIDRAALSATKIGDRTCIDNLVQIGHNCTLGKDCLIIGQAGMAGSTHMGDCVTLAAQSGVAGHLTIGSYATIGPQAGVHKDVPEHVTMGGSPLVDQTTYMRTLTLMPKFPELFKRLTKLEKELATLKGEKNE